MAEKPKAENIINEDPAPRSITPPEPPPEPKHSKKEIVDTAEIFERGLKTGLEIAKSKKGSEPIEPPKPIITAPPEPPKKKETDVFGFGIEK